MKILLDEGGGEKEGYDVIIPFHLRGDNDLSDFSIDYRDFESIVSKIHENLFGDFRLREKCAVLEYRGVDLLRCFCRKELYEFAFHAMKRYEIFKRILCKFSDAQFYISKKTSSSSIPSLFQVLLAAPLGNDPRLVFMEEPPKKGGGSWDCISRSRAILNFLWPSKLELKNSKPPTVLIYSDYKKAKSVMPLLGQNTALFFAHAPTCSFAHFFSKPIGFLQDRMPILRKKEYGRKIEPFIKRLYAHRLFHEGGWGELDAEKLLLPQVLDFFVAEGPGLIYAIDVFHNLCLAAPAPKTALLDEDVTPYKNAFCQTMKQYGVKTFVECHGSLENRYGYVPVTADFICAWGKRQKEKLIRWGCEADRVLVSGRSSYYRYRQLDAALIRRKIAKKNGLDPDRPIALIANSPFYLRCVRHSDSGFKETIGKILECIRDIPNVQFIVKLHALEQNDSFYQERLAEEKLKTKVKIISEGDSLLLAKAVDFLIVYRSTYAIDGLAMDKNIIFFQDGLPSACEEYLSYGVFHEATNKDELKVAIEKLAAAPKKKKGDWESMMKDCLPGILTGQPEENLAALLNGQKVPGEFL